MMESLTKFSFRKSFCSGIFHEGYSQGVIFLEGRSHVGISYREILRRGNLRRGRNILEGKSPWGNFVFEVKGNFPGRNLHGGNHPDTIVHIYVWNEHPKIHSKRVTDLEHIESRLTLT